MAEAFPDPVLEIRRNLPRNMLSFSVYTYWLCYLKDYKPAQSLGKPARVTGIHR